MDRLAYSVKEAAELTGLSQRTVTRQIQRGTLRAVRVSRRVLIPTDALAEFLGSRNTPRFIVEQSSKQDGGAT